MAEQLKLLEEYCAANLSMDLADSAEALHKRLRLKRDEIGLNRHRALARCLSMIFSENRFALFRDHALEKQT